MAQRNVGFEVIVGKGLRVGRRQGNKWEAVAAPVKSNETEVRRYGRQGTHMSEVRKERRGELGRIH